MPRPNVANLDRIFLSYSDHDSDLAERFHQWVDQTFGVKCFFAPRMPVGGEWYRKIIEGLRHCEMGVVLLTPTCTESPWVHFETGGILAQRKTLVPICFAPFTEKQIMPPLNFNQACSWSEAGRRKLADTFRDHLKLPTYNGQYIDDPGFIYDPNKSRKEWQQSAEAFLRHVATNLHRREEEQIGTAFHNNDDPLNFLVRWLLDHHWITYRSVIEAGSSRGAIPLPDQPRMNAAIAAVEAATKSVHAISIHSSDRWNYDSRYIRANIEAAMRIDGTHNRNKSDEHLHQSGVSRIIVISNEAELNKSELREIISEQKRNGIAVKWILDTVFEKLKADIYPEIHLRNVLIVDEKVVTRSHERSTDGELVISKKEIDEEKNRFASIWDSQKARVVSA